MVMIDKPLGLTEIDIDIDVLFEQYGMQNFNPEICRLEAIKRNSEIVTCDVCGVEGNYPNMMRWHFENCKTVLRNCEYCGECIPRQGIKNFLYDKKKYCNRECYMKHKKGKAPLIMTEEIKQKLRKPKSEEHKRKLSESRKGRNFGTRNKK
jgi:hypothetical protein